MTNCLCFLLFWGICVLFFGWLSWFLPLFVSFDSFISFLSSPVLTLSPLEVQMWSGDTYANMSEQQHGEPPSPIVQALHSLLYSWEEDAAVTRKSRLLKAALQRDCKCLIHDYPRQLAQWLPQAFHETDEFSSITHEIDHFIKYCLLPKLQCSYDEQVISPFAGGMRGKEEQETDAQQTLAELKLAV